MSVCCDCCVFSFRCLCPGLFTCSDESYGSLSVECDVCYQVEVFASR